MTSRLDIVAQETMDIFWNHFDKGHMNRSIAILRGIGYSAAALDVVLDKGAYYFPEHSGDDSLRPGDVSGDTIPIVALNRERTYDFEVPKLHSLQQNYLDAAGIDSAFFEKSEPATISSSAGSSNDASVSRQLFRPEGTSLNIESRPTMVFNPDLTRQKLAPICASAVMHELVHLAQSLSDPIWEDEALARKELEAYAVQAELVDSYYVDYSLNTAMAGHVNLHRKRYLGEHGFTPTTDFIHMARTDPALSKALKVASTQ